MSALYLILFFASVTIIILLPLTPAVREWCLKTDSQPLKVIREYDGDIMYFANSFRRYLNENFYFILGDSVSNLEEVTGPLEDGAAFQVVGVDGKPKFSASELSSQTMTQMVIGKSFINLPDEMFFEKEIYAASDIFGGHKISLRAILSDKNISLGDDCYLIRWAHSNDTISMGTRARLYGRISAGKAIQLRHESWFGRIQAPIIYFGAQPPKFVMDDQIVAHQKNLSVPTNIVDNAAGRWLVAGTLNVEDASFHRGSLVARKNLIIGRNCFIVGGLKSAGRLRLKGNQRIDGPVVAGGHMHIGPKCIIKGPIVCERMVIIAAGSIIGTPDSPTSITAPVIWIEEGVTVHGSVWAREVGYVFNRPKKAK